ncbi:GNAT family N-acetyltransferase [Streptomyces sp. HNM0574]|uniref:GNAT family N-acetyltransferase n=1 Tax=Streptomyces sp. HNM0574 TaxID=2714954 RepID=UPI00146B5DA8|nr:GNAT family N-acetyltransferase [Streptomyces sp. HNM0574]NLU70761.1 GNAT family N-acetyltransferase [Streptomyces sp. HNM0574]
MPNMKAALKPRPATAADIGEIIRLGTVMFEEAGMDASDPAWRDATRETLRRRLEHDVRVCVMDHPRRPGGLVAQAAGIVSDRLPDPSNPAGRAGYVLWTVTDPGWRGRGLARAVMTSLLEWFEAGGVPGVELHATAQGQPLYASLGFEPGAYPGLRRYRGPHGG